MSRLLRRRFALKAEESQRCHVERVGVALAAPVRALAVERPDEDALHAPPASFLQLLDEMPDERGFARAADGVQRNDVRVAAVPGFVEPAISASRPNSSGEKVCGSREVSMSSGASCG